MPSDVATWRQDVRPLYDADTIAQRVTALAETVSRDHEQQEIVAICVLKGAFVFYADLVRQLDLPVSCDFIGISSYGNTTKSSGVVQITRDLSHSIEDKQVLIVEDIIDSGLTMKYLLDNFRTRRPRQIRICTLLHKPECLRAKISIDYIGFSIPSAFVVGYGLDYAGRYRNLPFVGVYHGALSA